MEKINLKLSKDEKELIEFNKIVKNKYQEFLKTISLKNL